MDEENKYEMVEHPSHYNKYSVEVIEMMKKIYGEGCVAIWDELTAFKYRMRLGEKPNNPLKQDLDKENFYIDDKNRLNVANCLTKKDFSNFIKKVNEMYLSYNVCRVIGPPQDKGTVKMLLE